MPVMNPKFDPENWKYHTYRVVDHRGVISAKSDGTVVPS